MQNIFVVFLGFLILICGTKNTIAQNDILIEENSEDNNIAEQQSCDGPGSDPYRNFVFEGRCNCKKNVRGLYCEECKRHSFNLQQRNRHGCLRCFCSGLTTKCETANLYRSTITLSLDDTSEKLQLVYKDDLRPVEDVEVKTEDKNGTQIAVVEDLPKMADSTYYWRAPTIFLGDRSTAYGGYINFSTSYVIHSLEAKKWVNTPLVILKGNGLAVYYRSRKRHRKLSSQAIPLVEQSWYILRVGVVSSQALSLKSKTMDEGTLQKKAKKRKRAKRKDMMKILMNVEYILVKANFRANTQLVRLTSLSISDAEENDNSTDVATNIEKCTCPEGYSGFSCQHCSDGFTRNFGPSRKRDARYWLPWANEVSRKRKDVGDSMQKCQLCQCNGHSESCDRDTGKCMNCQNDTSGDHCQYSILKCDSEGTFAHKFAPNAGSKCICKARVGGDLCDTCKSGHFNLQPENEKGCTKCWCSGVTFKCSSAKLRKFQIRFQPPSFVNMAFSDGYSIRMWAIEVRGGKAKFQFKKKYEHFYNYHWHLSKKFTGNLLRSYGGHLNFSLYHHGSCDHNARTFPLVELESYSNEIVTWMFKPTVKMNSVVSFSVRFIEDNFLYYNMNVHRGTFLRILSSVKSIRIFTPDCASTIKSTELSSVVLDTAVSWGSDLLPLATNVEECQCPLEYAGLSCQMCSSGYVKDPAGKRCVRKTKK